MKLGFSTLSGADILPFIDDLAHLRMRVFREYPYLYDGTMEYERSYLKTLMNAPLSILVVAKDLESNQIVGASTACPLTSETEEIKAPFLNKQYTLSQLYYFSESVLLPEYRGKGAGLRFFEEREKMARLDKNIKFLTFCAVERDHSFQAPLGYKPLNVLWERQGFQRKPELFTYFSWREIGETTATPKKMVFWLKTLAYTHSR